VKDKGIGSGTKAHVENLDCTMYLVTNHLKEDA
jgi:hypothetical protein